MSTWSRLRVLDTRTVRPLPAGGDRGGPQDGSGTIQPPITSVDVRACIADAPLEEAPPSVRDKEV